MTGTELTKVIESYVHQLATETEQAKTSVKIVDYLRFTAQFHSYSFHNTLSIFIHCPHATKVAGFKAWQKLGRWVRKGERGIPILAPCTVKAQVESVDDEDPVRHAAYFRIVYVFDISQTDGKPIPEAPIAATGSDQGLLSILEQVAADHGIHLEYKTLAGSHHGTSYGGRIEIDDRLEPAGKASVILHELAHEFLHQHEDCSSSSRQQRELEAEATAFVVCTHFGIHTAAPEYLALWNVPEDDILASFQRIHQLAMQLVNEVTTLSTAPELPREAM